MIGDVIDVTPDDQSTCFDHPGDAPADLEDAPHTIDQSRAKTLNKFVALAVAIDPYTRRLPSQSIHNRLVYYPIKQAFF